MKTHISTRWTILEESSTFDNCTTETLYPLYHTQHNRQDIRNQKAKPNQSFYHQEKPKAERFKFFCTKPLDAMEIHNHWITRLWSNDDEATKMVITLQTCSDQLQTAIIKNDVNFVKVISTARTLELSHWEMQFINYNKVKPAVSDSQDIAAFHKRHSSQSLDHQIMA